MLDDIAPDLPQCPIDLIQHHLRIAAIAFCEDSNVYRYTCDAMDLVAGENEVDLDVPTQTEVSSVIVLTYGGQPIDPKGENDLALIDPYWMTATGDTPRFYYQTDPATVILYPIPTATSAASLSASVAVRPTENADGLEAWVYRKYRAGIIARAKADLKAMLNKPWTDRSMLPILEATYRNEVGVAIGEGVRSQTNTARRSRAFAF